MKLCNQCNKIKELYDYYSRNRKSGKKYYSKQCKDCSKNNSIKKYDMNKEKMRIQQLKYRKENKEKIRTQQSKYRKENKEKIKYSNQIYYSKKTKTRSIKPKYEKSEEEILRESRKNQKKEIQLINDKNLKNRKIVTILNENERRIIKNLRERTRNTITRGYKKDKTIHLLGCSVYFFKRWLEYNFDSKTSWSNYGIHWQIDHVIPCSSFKLTIKEEQLKCFNWRNCRPLEKSLNNTKNNKIINFDILMQELRTTHYLQHIQIAGNS